MKIKFIILIILTLSIISCNESNQQKNPKEIEPDIFKKSLTIEFNFKTSKSDQFKIMMNNIKFDEFQKKNIQIIEEVTPSTSEDMIVANFDAGNLSNNIIINLGNKEPKDVDIINISVSYGKKHFNISTPEDLDKYLMFNKFIERSADGNTISTKKVEGVLNPVIYFRLSFINLLKQQ